MKLKDFYTDNEITLNNEVSMYLCGPTVYSEAHIGNMRPIIIFDLLKRVLKHQGTSVKLVHNITDVDDKIILSAKNEGVSEKEISDKYLESYLNNLELLNIKTDFEMPKVTENIDGMIEFISRLVDNGSAYESNGSVYFSVKGYSEYGKLFNINLDELKDSENNEDKKDSLDFALWKKTGEGINWKSPWSEGRPGWHTECAYFVEKYFGNSGLDIHAGGIDLRFPHHTNEAAQYEACCNVKSMAKVWKYVGHVNIDNTKMSKSLGNIISAKDFIQEHSSLTLRTMMMLSSPMNPLDVTDEVIENTKQVINKIENSIRKSILEHAFANNEITTGKVSDKVIGFINDDLNTANAMTEVLTLVKTVNSDPASETEALTTLIETIKLLGFRVEVKFDELKDQLSKAKQDSDFETLDRLREEVLRIW